MSRHFSCLIVLSLLLIALASTALAQSSPVGSLVVANKRMQLTLRGEVKGTIEIGDLLSVLAKDEARVLVQSPSGLKTWLANSAVKPVAEAEEIFNQLIAKKPKEPSLYAMRAMCFAEQNNRQKAIADYSQAIKLGWKDAGAYINRGVLYSGGGEPGKAIMDFNKGIELGAKKEIVLPHRANAFMAEKQFSKAMSDYDEIVKLQPDQAQSYYQRGVAWRVQEEYAKAIRDLNKAVELAPKDITALSARGYTHFLAHDYSKAVADFDIVVDLEPGSALAVNNRGYNHQLLGKYTQALADYQKAIDLSPQYALAHQNKAWLLACCPDDKIRDGSAAVEAAKKACELREWKDFSDIKVYAAALAENGDFANAVTWQKKAIEMADAEEKQDEQKILMKYQASKPHRFVKGQE